MPCYPLIDKKGKSQGFLCGENLDLEMCPTCGAGLVEFLCDFPIGDYATCDRRLCLKCSSEIKTGLDIHLCPEHIIYFKKNSNSLYLHREIKKRRDENKRIEVEIILKDKRMEKISEKVAAGLRNMDRKPDAFLFCDGWEDWTWDEGRICGIPVFHTTSAKDSLSDTAVNSLPFIPIWRDEDDYCVEREQFIEGCDDYVERE